MFKLSPEAALDGVVTVENKFIVEYMPYADGDYVKVYLYGLSLAGRKQDADDDIARLARRLDLDITTVNAAVDYWCERGLMSKLGDDVTYYPTKAVRQKIKKYDVDKYAEFNRQSQQFISERMISANEFNEYYALMEKYEIEWQAMTLIVKYCVDLKGGNVSCPYILAVARNLAADGYRTHDQINEKLEEYGVYYNDLRAVTNALGIKRPDHEAVELYKKWVKQYKFDRDVIQFVAAGVKRGGLNMLNKKLSDYKDLGLFTIEAITAYENDRKAKFNLAKAINKAIGVYYENVEPEITMYITPWTALGFSENGLLSLASYCMKNNLKSLSDLDVVVRDCFGSGIITDEQISAKLDTERKYDDDILRIMKKCNVAGGIKNTYRAYYADWVEKLNISKDLIEYGASLCQTAANAFSYLNKILLSWSESGITTVEQAAAANKTATEQIIPERDEKDKQREQLDSAYFEWDGLLKKDKKLAESFKAYQEQMMLAAQNEPNTEDAAKQALFTELDRVGFDRDLFMKLYE